MTAILPVLNAAKGHPAEAALRAINESTLPGIERYKDSQLSLEQIISDVGALAAAWESKSDRDESSFRFTFSNTPSVDGLVTNKVYVAVSAIGSSDTSAVNTIAPTVTGLVPASSSSGESVPTRKTSESSLPTGNGRSIALIYYAADDLIDRVTGGAKSPASLNPDTVMDAHLGIRINKGSSPGVVEAIEIVATQKTGEEITWDTDLVSGNALCGVAYSVADPLFNKDDGSVYVPFRESQIIHCFVADLDVGAIASIAATVTFKGDDAATVALDLS